MRLHGEAARPSGVKRVGDFARWQSLRLLLTLPQSRLADASRGFRHPLPCRGWHVRRWRQPSPVPFRIHHGDHFLYIVGYGYRGELRTGQLASSIVKASEAAVMLDLTEDGLRLDGAHASVVQAPLAGKQFLRMIPVLPAADIYINDPVPLAFEA